MKKIIIPIVLLLSVYQATAQKEYDSIKRLVENYKGASNIIIPNVRQMIMDQLDSNNIAGAEKIYNYAVQVLPEQGIIAFYESERILLAYILHDERFLVAHITEMNAIKSRYEKPLVGKKRYTYPTGNDDLWGNVLAYTLNHFEGIRQQFYTSTTLSREDARVLLVYYRYILADNKKAEFSSLRIEKEIKDFFGASYTGKYQLLVNTLIIKDITPAKLHFNFEGGLGAVFRGKDIKHYMPVMAGIHFLTGVEYKHSVFEVIFMENASKLRKPLPVKNELWSEDSSVLTHNISATLGYFVVDNARLGIYPFAGATMAWMQPEYNGPMQSKRTVVRSNAGLVTGVAFQYKFKRFGYSYSTRKGGDYYSYLGLRLSYVSRNFNDPALRANAFQCTFSFMGEFGERLIMLPWSWFNNRGKTYR